MQKPVYQGLSPGITVSVHSTRRVGWGGEAREQTGKGKECSFCQQLIAGQTGPVSQTTHSTLQRAPKPEHRKALRRNYETQRTVKTADLPRDMFF